MNVMKLGFLVFMALAVANAAPVKDDVVLAVVNDINGVHSREGRSTEKTEVPWYLDRVDQRKPKLDGKYNAFANGNVAK